ncbi:LPS export ABC transporter permease LptG [Lutimaribacter sp. EGI FJ00015]|uniref:LPS export ABC transporter permease LptG n=1 Tax=Lutimaribacter degradans TaxID=2945989 RepID=A0ACC5ZSF8_9RHOB|nr:LPS export ABC transporter permease LptG [Lutimaribacter sp. EGI FJ00013]MCM2561212.1 LPS export ABC transporter permease LptG [Lutimaribacter sp. EGI FJ00013]MCO0611839.1 LPS export ABC transporter permease LptG [Lutimaribacter sp. EGI FJ00015]MCO0635040.1 LPS export ABC transporter permease LptG [Lutimaribacter sp. EGI FJ00014]
MILHAYFARKFLIFFGGVFGVFLLLLLLIDMVEQMRRFGGEISFAEVLTLTALNTPMGLYGIMPLIMILATVAMFLGLSRSSELVVTRAVGRSSLRALLAPFAVVIVIGALTVAMFNPIVAATSKRYELLQERYRSGGQEVFSISSEGLWLRQGDEAGQTVIRATRAAPDGTVLYDVTFLVHTPEGGPIQRIEAQSAELVPGAWELSQAKVWPLAAGINPEAMATRHETLRLSSSLTMERIRGSLGDPSVISVWDMPAYITQLEEAGFSARRHAVWFQMELARPLFLVAMLLVGAGFTMRHVRFRNTGIAVLSAVILGFTLYYIRNFAQILGETGQIPIVLAAWAPPVASVMLGLGILLIMEDG